MTRPQRLVLVAGIILAVGASSYLPWRRPWPMPNPEAEARVELRVPRTQKGDELFMVIPGSALGINTGPERPRVVFDPHTFRERPITYSWIWRRPSTAGDLSSEAIRAAPEDAMVIPYPLDYLRLLAEYVALAVAITGSFLVLRRWRRRQ